MRRAEEILAEIPHSLHCPAKNSTGFCKCMFTRSKAAIEQAQQEAIEEAANVVWHFRGQPGRAIFTAVSALLPHREGQ